MITSGLSCSTLIQSIDDVMMVGLNKQTLARVLVVFIRDTFQRVGVNSIMIQGHLPVKI